MRTREKARIWRRFMAGESVYDLSYCMWSRNVNIKFADIESIIREGATGKFDAVPMKQARVYARLTGVKIRKVVEV
jgi:hypothetical protein